MNLVINDDKLGPHTLLTGGADIAVLLWKNIGKLSLNLGCKIKKPHFHLTGLESKTKIRERNRRK